MPSQATGYAEFDLMVQDDVRGRANALFNVIALLLTPLAQIGSGVVSDALGISALYSFRRDIPHIDGRFGATVSAAAAKLIKDRTRWLNRTEIGSAPVSDMHRT